MGELTSERVTLPPTKECNADRLTCVPCWSLEVSISLINSIDTSWSDGPGLSLQRDLLYTSRSIFVVCEVGIPFVDRNLGWAIRDAQSCK